MFEKICLLMLLSVGGCFQIRFCVLMWANAVSADDNGPIFRARAYGLTHKPVSPVWLLNNDDAK